MISEENNKINSLYFENPTMRGLYEDLKNWQEEKQKRLLSLSIQKEGNVYACIALTNPTEVVISNGYGSHQAKVGSGSLYVKSD